MKKIYYFLFISISIFSQNEKDYNLYHDQINQAELNYFMEGKVDSSLIKYDIVFENYDFIFLKDILNAAQIAKISNRDFKKYIIRSFEFGFKIESLKSFPLLKDLHSEYVKDTQIIYSYKIGRKKYLDKIDYVYLDYIYKIAIQDQIDKYKDNYSSKINSTVNKLIDTIQEKGFPGEKLLGVSDTLIFKERGLRKIDINDRARRLKITRHYILRKIYCISGVQYRFFFIILVLILTLRIFFLTK